MLRSPIRAAALLAAPMLLSACSGPAASDAGAVPVQIKGHVFTPAEITVPANQPVVLAVTNADGVAEEFDSDSLKVEKVIAGGQKAMVRLRPLPSGRYPFMGEYHSKTAQGVVVAK